LFHEVSHLRRREVFPDVHGFPTGCAEALIRVTIPGSVRLDLCQPPVPIAHWRDEVLGTSVPETSVDEDREANSGEGDVNAPPRQPRDRVLNSKSSSTSMKFPPEGGLGVRPFSTLPLEALTDSRVRGMPWL
jgi:hypothetical protein